MLSLSATRDFCSSPSSTTSPSRPVEGSITAPIQDGEAKIRKDRRRVILTKGIAAKRRKLAANGRNASSSSTTTDPMSDAQGQTTKKRYPRVNRPPPLSSGMATKPIPKTNPASADHISQALRSIRNVRNIAQSAKESAQHAITTLRLHQHALRHAQQHLRLAAAHEQEMQTQRLVSEIMANASSGPASTSLPTSLHPLPMNGHVSYTDLERMMSPALTTPFGLDNTILSIPGIPLESTGNSTTPSFNDEIDMESSAPLDYDAYFCHAEDEHLPEAESIEDLFSFYNNDEEGEDA